MRGVHLSKAVSITPRESQSFKIYLKEIARYDPLSMEEEVLLFKRVAEGDQTAKDKIIKHNLRFVVSVAKKFYSHNLKERAIMFDDVVSAGNEGLMVAVDKHDITRGFKFISFAVWYIKQRILSFLSYKQIVHLPANMYTQLNKMNRHMRKLEVIEKRDLVAEDVIFRMGYENGMLENVYKANYFYDEDTIIKLEDDIPDTNSHFINEYHYPDDEKLELRYIDKLVDEDDSSRSDYTMLQESLTIEIFRAFETLSKREMEVLMLYFGLLGEEKTLEEMGEKFQLPRDRVRQIKEKAIRRIKHSTRCRHFSPFLGIKGQIPTFKFRSFMELLQNKSREYVQEKKHKMEVLQEFKVAECYCGNCGKNFSIKQGNDKEPLINISCPDCASTDFEIDEKKDVLTIPTIKTPKFRGLKMTQLKKYPKEINFDGFN